MDRHGRMDKWMGYKWLNGQQDGWMEGRINRQYNVYIKVDVHEQTGELTELAVEEKA